MIFVASLATAVVVRSNGYTSAASEDGKFFVSYKSARYMVDREVFEETRWRNRVNGVAIVTMLLSLFAFIGFESIRRGGGRRLIPQRAVSAQQVHPPTFPCAGAAAAADRSHVKRETTAKRYSIQILGRGEAMTYADSQVKLSLEQTLCDGHRIYCDSIANSNGPALPFAKRQEVILNLCDFFETADAAVIFVVDERDKDRHTLEVLFAELAAQGHKVSIEYDSAEKREQFLDEMYLSDLRPAVSSTSTESK